MRLSEFTDYTLRVLIFCAARPQERITVLGLAGALSLSKNHLMKIVHHLAKTGLVETVRGRGGGLRLLTDPAAICVGDVVRACENDFRLVECFDRESNTCTLTHGCRLKKILKTALQNFYQTLDAVTLADLLRPAPKVLVLMRPPVLAQPFASANARLRIKR